MAHAIHDQVVVITGASSGMGHEMALGVPTDVPSWEQVDSLAQETISADRRLDGAPAKDECAGAGSRRIRTPHQAEFVCTLGRNAADMDEGSRAYPVRGSSILFETAVARDGG